jgi:hypothetical protein
MAGQRRGEPHRQRGRGPGRLGRLALVLALVLTLGACGAGGPTGTDRPRDDDGISGGGSAAERLVGTWQVVLVVEVPGDIQTWTTTWRFDADGDCRFTRETESLAEGFPRVTERDCTYAIDGAELVISFADGGSLTSEFSFAGFSPDRLIFDGFEYRRLA